MAVVARPTHSGTVYWVVTSTASGQAWERSGTDKRKAERLDAKRKRQVRGGTFRRDKFTAQTSFGHWAEQWAAVRPGRNAKREARAFAKHVLGRRWLTILTLAELEQPHVERLVTELKASGISTKTAANMYGLVRTCVRDARRRNLVKVDPCILKRRTFRKKVILREAYVLEDVLALCTSPALPPWQRMWNTLAFFTGARQGEVCGLRWGDWDESPKPLGSLMVAKQYEGRPLKTEDEAGEQPRMVPVHPVLARALAEWRREGFELTYLRPPQPGDPIVPTHGPRLRMTHHTSSTSYKAWVRACKASGVENRSLHLTRHTFISMCRRGGARKELVERITHNAAGDIVDRYTHWDWAPLCDAVLCMIPSSSSGFHALPEISGAVDRLPDESQTAEGSECRRRESNPRHQSSSEGTSAESGGALNEGEPPRFPAKNASADSRSASQPRPLAKVSPADCPECGGRGEVVVVSSAGSGGLPGFESRSVYTCATCGGRP